MARDRQVENTELSTENTGKELIDVFVDSYKSIFDVEQKVDDLEKLAGEIVPDEFNICDIPDYIEKATTLMGEVVKIPNEMASALNQAMGTVKDTAQNKLNEKDGNSEQLKISPKTLAYAAMGIILKRFQIIQYRIKYLQKFVELKLAELRKKLLIEMLKGKDDAGSAISLPLKQLILVVGVVANVISTIVGILLTFINAIVILNVDASGCAFGPTPKSLMMTSKMVVANTRMSTTNNIPEPIDQLIAQAETSIEQANGEIKKARVLTMSSNAASKVANGGQFSVEPFGQLPKFDASIIRDAIKIIMALLLDAEALPRYEKLSIINIRFLVFLITGFEPAAKKTFGFPGFP